MRPEYDAKFQDASGKTWKSIEWHREKYRVFRAPILEQEQSATLTGKDGYTGLWSPPQTVSDVGMDKDEEKRAFTMSSSIVTI